MNLLFHTISVEPARWLPARVSRPLAEILPAIARAGLGSLEIFEPHLALTPEEDALPAQLARLNLAPIVLSSYLDLAPGTNPDPAFASQAEALLARVDRFGFRKVRLFPGRAASPDAVEATFLAVAERLRCLADARPQVEFVVETHSNSLADDTALMVRLMEACARPNVGLLWQPVNFEAAAARAQLAAQKAWVRHIHLSNLDAAGKFTLLADGSTPWPELLATLDPLPDLTLEFVPAGICAMEEFNLDATLRQIREEFDRVAGWGG